MIRLPSRAENLLGLAVPFLFSGELTVVRTGNSISPFWLSQPIHVLFHFVFVFAPGCKLLRMQPIDAIFSCDSRNHRVKGSVVTYYSLAVNVLNAHMCCHARGEATGGRGSSFWFFGGCLIRIPTLAVLRQDKGLNHPTYSWIHFLSC